MEEIRNERVAALVLGRLVVIVFVVAVTALVPSVARAISASSDPAFPDTALPGTGSSKPESSDLAPMTDFEREMAIDAARRATVRVSAAGCGARITGSGFVADGLLITNGHIVGDAREVLVDRLDARGAPLRSNEAIDARSGADDLAIALVPWDGSLPLSDVVPSAGEPVLLVGYGGGRKLSIIETSVHSYVVGAAYGSEGKVLLLDRATAVGFSGGPVINRRGEVVGVLRAFDSVTGLSIAVPTANVVELANRAANDAEESLCK